MTHVFNITHVIYWILSQEGSYFKTTAFEKFDKLALIIAAMGHDLNHPGIGNTYFVKANHIVSSTVNGASVLENFHCYTLFKLLEDSQLLTELGDKKQKIIDTMKELIMCTDMAKHATVMKNLDGLKGFDKMLPEKEKLVLMSVVLHASDISNPCMKFSAFREWGLRIV